jgi:hypothetical protein
MSTSNENRRAGDPAAPKLCVPANSNGAATIASTDNQETNVTPHHPITEEYAPFTLAETVAMRISLKENGLLMPIATWNGQIVDGRHRERLCRELRIRPRYNDITKKFQTEAEMRRYVAALNEHRRSRTTPLTNAEKRSLVAVELKVDPERSNRQIAETVKVDHKTVASVRAETEARGEIPHVETRTDTKGRKQAAHKPPTSNKSVPVVSATLSDAKEEDQGRTIRVLYALTGLTDAMAAIEPETVAVGVMPDEVDHVLNEVETIRNWLDRFAALVAKPQPANTSTTTEPPPISATTTATDNEAHRAEIKAEWLRNRERRQAFLEERRARDADKVRAATHLDDYPELPAILDRRAKP